MTLENDPAGFLAFKVVRRFFFRTPTVFAWVRVYRARRSKLQISKKKIHFFKIGWPAPDIVDQRRWLNPCGLF